jgi:hypothetical protein
MFYLVVYKTPVDSYMRELKSQKNSKGLIGRRYNLIRADRSKAKDQRLMVKVFYFRIKT